MLNPDHYIREASAIPPHFRRLIVAYSGGLDSHALLHRLAMQQKHQKCGSDPILEAVYVDHGLQSAASTWGRHCAGVCGELGIPFRVLKVDARPLPGESPEAAARRARYATLAAQLQPDTALLTAHHRDDQAETLLLQLLRGAGPQGLAAMPSSTRLGQGWLIRPFLNVDRADLLAYAQTHQLHWIEDTSNTDTAFDRNYLRQRIMPVLAERWPAVSRNLARSAWLCAEAAHGLDEQAASDLAKVISERPDALSVAALGTLSERQQRQVVRYWLRQQGLPVPSSRQLQGLLHDSLTARHDRQPCTQWAGAEVRRYRDRLYAMPPLPAHESGQRFSWEAYKQDAWPSLDLPGVGRLQMAQTLGEGLSPQALSEGRLIVRFRMNGERFRPVGRAHSQELKKLLQDAGIPPWQRERLPLLYKGQALVMVVGLGVATDYAAKPGDSGWKPVLLPFSSSH